MPYIDHQAYKQYLLGDIPLPTPSGSPSTPTPLSASSPTRTTLSAPPPVERSSTAVGTPSTLFDPSQQSLVSGFRAPLEEKLSRARTETQGLLEGFHEQAGPRRDYESAGAEDILRNALQIPTSEKGATYMSPEESDEAFQGAKDLLSASYGGPSGLDPEGASKVRQSFSEALQARSALGSGAGFASALQAARPGLTPGEARWDTSRTYGTSEWRDAFKAPFQVPGDLPAAEKTAKAFAEARSAEESDIASRSREYVSGRQSEIDERLGERLKEALAANEATKSRLEEIRGGAEYDPRKEVANYELLPGEQRLGGAGQALANIWGQYPDIVDIPQLGLLNIGRIGEAYGLPGTDAGPSSMAESLASYGYQWGDPTSDFLMRTGQVGINDPRVTEWTNPETGEKVPLTPELRRQLVARQKALEEQFRDFEWPGIPDQQRHFEDVAPLYFGEFYEPGDMREDLYLQEGTVPQAGDFATGDERFTYNRAAELLDSGKRLSEAAPFEAAKIFVDLNQFLMEEQARLGDLAAKGDRQARLYIQGAREATNDIKRWLNEHPELMDIVRLMSTQAA